MTTTLSVQGMTCQHCVASVTEELMEVPGVTSVDVDLDPGAVSTVRVDAEPTPSAERLLAAVKDAGYTAEVTP